MNRADLTKTVLLYDQLAAAAKDKAAIARAELDRQAKAELESQGMAPTWRLPDVGTITLPISQETIYVSDADVLAKWAIDQAENAVGVVTKLVLNPEFQRELEKRLVVSGDVVVDSQTGEVVPGYAVRHGGLPMSLSIRPSADAKAVARVHAEGLLERFASSLTGEVEA